MADPDTLIQKILHKSGYFNIDIAFPNIPKRLRTDYNLLKSDYDKLIFRKLWEKANAEERKNIISDIDYELNSSDTDRSSKSSVWSDDSTDSDDSDDDDYSKNSSR